MLDCQELEQDNTQGSVLCGKSEKIIMDISSQDLTVDFNFAECEKAANEQKTNPVKNETADISKYLLVPVTAGEKTHFFRRKQVPKKSHNLQANYI